MKCAKCGYSADWKDIKSNDFIEEDLNFVATDLYSCMHGHLLWSDHDLSMMFCPVCLGAVKDKTLNDPRLLSIVQD